MSPQKIFASPQDVEAAFYEALERGDLDAMMAVWAEDEDVVCIHPGSPRLVGYALIREAFRQLFDHGLRIAVRVARQTTVTTPFAVVISVLEHVGSRHDEGLRAPVAATNVYVRGAMGWRMVAHHASVVPPGSADEPPKVLH